MIVDTTFYLLFMPLVKLVPVEIIVSGICKANIPIPIFVRLFLSTIFCLVFFLFKKLKALYSPI
jgi:hypothetical protein